LGSKTRLKKIWYSLFGKDRTVLLDYPVHPKRLYREDINKPHGKLNDLIEENRGTYIRFIDRVRAYERFILEIESDSPPDNSVLPHWTNGYFPGLDIIMLYTLIAEVKPKRYVEIGSGTSTRVVYKSRKDNQLGFTITSIDPHPRLSVLNVADAIKETELQRVPLDFFSTLEDGDILFFDGTHTLYPNSDVMWFFLEVLPILKKGVYVHVHDVYWPFDYPEFMCERYYNEQYILAACLLNAPQRYEIIFPNYFVYTRKDLHDRLDFLWGHERLKNVETHGGSFWIRIRN